MNDLKFAIRQLLKSPGFTAVAVLTLALGIGANTAIFSIINAVLLKPLPFPNPDRLVQVHESPSNHGKDKLPVAGPTFLDWRAQTKTFESLAAQQTGLFNLTGRGEARRLPGERVSANILAVLGVKPFLGRPFLPEEEKYGNHHVVILSHSFWQQEFGANPDIVGKTMTLEGNACQIVGVLPPRFNYPNNTTQLLVPLAFAPDDISRQNRILQVIGRLKQGTTLAEASAEMNTIAARLDAEHPEVKGTGVSLAGLQDELVGGSRKGLLILLGAVGLVLLIACTNVVNLMLIRTSFRSKEFAIRVALGAPRGRIMRQLLTESLVLTGSGGVLGVLLAGWTLSSLVSLQPLELPRLREVSLDLTVLGFSLALTIGTALVFCFVHMIHSSRNDVNEALKDGGRQSSSAYSRSSTRDISVIAQVAMSLVLLVGAGLLIRSLSRLNSVDAGFDPGHLLTARVSLSETRFTSEAQAAVFIHQLVEKVGQLPGVDSAGAIFGLPLEGMDPATSARLLDRPATAANEPSGAGYHQVSPGYFKTMGTTLLKGRDFDTHDTAKGNQVVIVNESFVRAFSSGEELIGRRLKIGAGPGLPVEIIGVVRDVRHNALTEKPRPEIYVPFSQQFWGYAALVIKTKTEPGLLAPALRKAVAELDPELPLDKIEPMTALMSDNIAQRRFQTSVLTLFAGTALVLAALGIYGVSAYSVSRRTQEIGIRMALGARASDILRLITANGMRPVMLGLTIGVALAIILARLIRGLLFEVTPHDPITYLVVAAVLSVVAGIACYLPAHRAAKVDPMIALRTE